MSFQIFLDDYRFELSWTKSDEWLCIQKIKSDFEFGDDRIILREPREEDRESFIKGLGKLEHPEYGSAVWNSVYVEKAWFCSIIDRALQKYVGSVEIKDMSQPLWEIGITILPEYKHKGYGTHSIPLFTKNLTDRIRRTEFQLKVMADNIESQGLMEKIGAKLVGITSIPTVFGMDEEYVEMQTNLITEHIEKMAAVLHMNPRKLLSHALDYRIYYN